MLSDREKMKPDLDRDLDPDAPGSDTLPITPAARRATATRRSARDRITPRETSGPAPLSFVQERLWFFDQLVPGCPAYNSFRALRLSGPLELSTLQRTLDTLLLRHDALRTTFPLVNVHPVQIVNPAGSAALVVEDLSALGADEQTATLNDRVVAVARQPFNLARDSLLRSVLFRLHEDDHVLVLVTHHIVFDAWSAHVLLREFSGIYDAFSTGDTMPFGELPIRYEDFAVWQREHIRGERLEALQPYWREQFAGGLPVLQMPTDRSRPAVQTFAGARASMRLPASLLGELKALSRQEGATLFMTLLAAYNALLARYSGQERIVVGSPIAGRTRVETEGLIGCFINTLAFNTDLSGDPSFRGLLGRVRANALGAYAHQELPFEKLVEDLQPERDLSHTPVFQTMFQLRNIPRKTLQSGTLRIEEMEFDPGIAKFDLTLEAVEHPDGIECSCEYASDLFERATIERLLGHYRTLLESAVSDPDLPLSHLPLLTPPERQQLLVDWNATQQDYPRGRCLHQLIDEQVERTPDAVAVVYGNQALTYRELTVRANQLAHYLQTLGVGPDVPVGLCVERSLELVVGLLAILKAGGAYVPMDPSYPQERLAYMLEDAQAPVLLTQAQLVGQVHELANAGVQVVCLDADVGAWAGQSTLAPSSEVSSAHLAYIIYTSGSTGKPKGVMISHEAICNHMHWMRDQLPLTRRDRVLQKTAISFDASVWEFYAPLLEGAQLIMGAPDIQRDPSMLIGHIVEQEVTIFQVVPSLLGMLLEHPEVQQCSTLRRVFCGGEALTVELQQRFAERLPHAELYNLYGPTEACIDATWWHCQNQRSDLRSVPIGRPIANTQVYVLDHHLEPVPVGVPGELYIGGVCLARGYLNRPELTAERFIPHPFSDVPGDRLYRTGDQARYLPSGAIEYLGRRDHQVKIRGFRIELGEIEAVVTQHPDVHQAAVLMREDHRSGSGGKQLVAYVVARQGVSLMPRTLRQDIAQHLPDYMVPAVFVILESLPVTPNGKLDRAALPAPDWAENYSETFVAPRTATEEALGYLWADILEIGPVGIHDDFFALGGHSLLATRVIVGVADSLGVTLPVRALFEAPTIASLAERIEYARHQPQGVDHWPLVISPRVEELPLSFTQERFWFLEQLTPGTATYNVPMILRIEGQLDIRALERSLSEIARRHETLRTSYVVSDGTPIQRIVASEPLKLRVVDLDVTSEAARTEEALTFARRDFEKPFDLARGPLFRAQVLRLAPEDHLLVLTIHHSICDGWSINVLYRELTALYAAFSTNQPSPLSDLAVQYADYAVWQRAHLQGDTLAQHGDYWQHQLAGAPLLLQLPTDRPRPMRRAFRGERHQFDIPKDVSDQLQRLSRQEGATLYMALLAAFQTLLSRYTGQEDLLVGSPIAGRTRAETENLIGCFLNILVLRGDLSGDPTFRELLARVREVALGAYAHQDLPFERLLGILETPRESSYSPVVQVLFILQNTPRSTWTLPRLNLRPLDFDTGSAKYDLTLEIVETDAGLRGSFQYDSYLFDAATIARMASHFQTLLAGIASDPDQHISLLPLLASGERNQVLDEWNATESPYPIETSLITLFEAQVERTPDAVAFTCRGEALTYSQLNTQANQLARYLRRLGVGSETLVGVCMERSFALVIALLGIFKAGGAYVPLDPEYPLDRIGYMLTDSRASVLLGTKALLERFPPSDAHFVPLDADEEQVAIAAESQANLDDPTATKPDSLAYVLYTSGSTGQPKGVAVEHRQLLNRFAWMWGVYPFATEEVGCQKTSINFVDSLWEIFGPLVQGVRSVIIPDRVLKEPDELLEELAAERVTRLWVVPSFLRALLEAYPDLAKRVPDLTFWAIGGEALTPELYALFHDRMPGCALVNIYGASEFFDATFFDCRTELANMSTVPIGRPLANMQAYILDTQRQPTPIGVPGDLYIGGVGLARGYLHQPEMTAERFIAHPFSADPHVRLYRTGDTARWRSDGYLEYLGRVDHQVKIRGFRIELGEIEATLARHPAVRQNVVIVREDRPSARQLVAYVVLRENIIPAPTAQELRRYMEDYLPLHMTPVATVILPEFPLTPSGKVHRLALPAPVWIHATESSAGTAPLNAVERELAQIWEEMLGVSPIISQDNFFDLGGHSLLAVRMFARLEAVFGVKLPLSVLFRAPTVEQLAAMISHKQPSHASGALVTIQQGGAKPPLFLVHPLGAGVLRFATLARYLGSDQPVYGLQPDVEEPSTDIVKMAADYIDAMRTAQPNGPYHLVGYSAGGLIALEIAQQLRQMGERVGLLGMLDTYAPAADQHPRKLLNAQFVGRLLRDLPGYLSEYVTQRTMRARLESLRVLSGVVADKLAHLLFRSRDSQSQPFRAMLFDAWMDRRATQLPANFGNLVRAHTVAVRNYMPQDYPGHVTIFRAASQTLFSSHYLDLGWGRLADSITIYRVPGSHSTLVAEPHVRVLAERLSASLLEVSDAHSSATSVKHCTPTVMLEVEEAAQ